jgi:serine/threonine-protein kinase RsbW
MAEVTILSDLAEGRRIGVHIEEELRNVGYSDHDVFAIKLALEEALVNAIKHGNQLDPDKRVQIAYKITSERFEITITDEGPGFNPEEVPDPTAIENIERPCGRGLLLMRGFMTEVRYHGKGNTVWMSKVKDNGPPSTS